MGKLWHRLLRFSRRPLRNKLLLLEAVTLLAVSRLLVLTVPPRLEGSRHDPTPRASFEALPPYECSEFDRGQLSLEEPDEVLPRQNFFLANRVQVTNALLPEHEPVVALHDFSFISRPRPLNHRRERIPRTRLERCFGATCDGSLRTQRRSRPSGKVLGSRLLHRMPTALAGC